jgi:hypothetical protein
VIADRIGHTSVQIALDTRSGLIDEPTKTAAQRLDDLIASRMRRGE